MRSKLFLKRVIGIIVLLITLFNFGLFGCSNDNENQPFPIINEFCVYYLDVGEGDCIFINLPDGKRMVIDTGLYSNDNYNKLKNLLTQYNVSKIDYLVLTHPDADHIGNAFSIIQDYTVEKAFVPDIYNKQLYTEFNGVFNMLIENGCQITYPSVYTFIEGEEYYIAFLSPNYTESIGYYSYFNSLEQPNSEQVNNLSPIIYLEYKGVTFLFTGDANYKQEQIFIEYKKIGLFNFIHKPINLDDIDFLKVGHHGAEDCTSEEFVYAINPQNAVISVGGNNIYGHPSTKTISRLCNQNINVNVLRTDVCGTIAVGVNQSGEYTTYKQSDYS